MAKWSKAKSRGFKSHRGTISFKWGGFYHGSAYLVVQFWLEQLEAQKMPKFCQFNFWMAHCTNVFLVVTKESFFFLFQRCLKFGFY